jgi:hypothetical protein
VDPFVPDPLLLPGIDWEVQIPLIGKTNRALAHYGRALRCPQSERAAFPVDHPGSGALLAYRGYAGQFGGGAYRLECQRIGLLRAGPDHLS